jgi:hypothetical protein
MRKIMMIVTLAVSWVALSATLNAFPPPECAPDCVLVR